MTNYFNSLSQQPIQNHYPTPKSEICSLNLNTQKRIKPFPGEGHMLPSRIFGSPVAYFNSLKDDIATISKGANGKANDHELGRLNDLAMKTGSLLLAAYLFTTKPFKTSKAMEFVGFGTFFASMALWPKLAIQAPIKARTGVDIHQKYQDSQGRQKMFFQDPQYTPWDLVSQEQLDKMGKKLNIPEDTPNRNAVIQERAQKTAVQGNTLWMLTSGFATPVLSALACNALEPKVDKAILNHTLKSSQSHLEHETMTLLQKFSVNSELKKVHKYLESISNMPLTAETIDKIAKTINPGSLTTQKAIAQEITTLAQQKRISSIPVTKDILTKIVSDFATRIDDPNALKALSEEFISSFRETELNEGTIRDIAKSLTEIFSNNNQFKKREYLNYFTEYLSDMFATESTPKVSSIKAPLQSLTERLSEVKAGTSIFDRFLSLRTQKQPNTVLGNKYKAFNKSFMDMLGINPKKATITDSAIEESIEKLVRSESFDASVDSLGKQVESYRKELNLGTLFGKIDSFFDKLADKFNHIQYEEIARDLAGKTLDGENPQGSLKNAWRTEVSTRVLGAESSFYRTLQTLDLFKKLETGDFERSLRDFNLSSEEIEAAKKYAKDFLLKGTIVDYSDKAKQMGNVSGQKIHDAVMEVLFNDERYGTIIGNDTLKARLRAYKGEFKRRIIDTIKQGDTTSKEAFEGITKHNLVGEPVVEAIKNGAQNIKNSNKWLKIFGSAALALVGITLIAGTTFGKGKKNNNVEEGGKQ